MGGRDTSQLADPDLKKPSFLKRLYLTGHWTTHGLRDPRVVYVGYDTAKSIMRRKERIIWIAIMKKNSVDIGVYNFNE